MNAEQWWRSVLRLLDLGLIIQTRKDDNCFVVRVLGGKTTATGVSESFYEAFQRATWRWMN